MGQNMFTRVVAARTKPGKASELVRTYQEKVLPLLGEQRGLVEAILLVPDTDPDQVLAISVWENRLRCCQFFQPRP
jgi:quinol monooxygenase YgiN